MTTYQVTAEEEFARNQELRKEDVQELREWMRSKPNLPHVPGMFLIKFMKKVNVTDLQLLREVQKA